jgi:outer membrane biogenesis lipoprotein LolB
MKKYILRIVALLVLASAVLPSCSIEYRQRHHHDHDNHDNNDHHDQHDRN